MGDTQTITFERKRGLLVKKEEEDAAAVAAAQVAVGEATPGFKAAFGIWQGLLQAWASSILGRYEARRDARIAGGGVGGVSVEMLVRIWVAKLQEFITCEHSWANGGACEEFETNSKRAYRRMMKSLRLNYPAGRGDGEEREEKESEEDWKQRVEAAYVSMKHVKGELIAAKSAVKVAEMDLQKTTRDLDRLMRKRAEQLHDRAIMDRQADEQEQQEQQRFARWLEQREMHAHGDGDEMMSEEHGHHIDYESDSTDDGKMWDHASGVGAPPEWTRRLGF
jgi:hypothetical protein